jgi:hypothetical protein
MLAIHVQLLAAADENSQARRSGKQFCDLRSSTDDVLQVIQHQQEVFFSQMVFQQLADGLFHPNL